MFKLSSAEEVHTALRMGLGCLSASCGDSEGVCRLRTLMDLLKRVVNCRLKFGWAKAIFQWLRELAFLFGFCCGAHCSSGAGRHGQDCTLATIVLLSQLPLGSPGKAKSHTCGCFAERHFSAAFILLTCEVTSVWRSTS